MSESRRHWAEIITIGDELLSGQVVNGDAAFLGRTLMEIGIPVRWSSAVADDIAEIQAALSQSLKRASVVVLSGGLGPTPDDVTKEAVANFFGFELAIREDLLEAMKARFARYGRTMPDASRGQALLPRGAEVIPNPLGTAPGMHIRREGREVFVLPGVPHELEGMVQSYVVPWLQENFRAAPIASKTLQTTGIGESLILERLQDLRHVEELVDLAFLPSPVGVTLHLSAKSDDPHEAEAQLAEAEGLIRESIGQFVYATGKQSLAEVIARILTNRHKTVAVAESCTGGLVAHTFTNIPGSSNFFERGFVTYSNRSKTELLNVPEALIQEYGAVSEQVARAMAEGARRKAKTDYGLATTGIAGPDGGTPEKPVGTAWVAVADARETVAEKIQVGYTREGNKMRFAQMLLFLCYKRLMQESD
ncbi:MAG: competence/damage-inducible protein A [Calditrichaeota bacterium]|nr:competence/damage-inducible protein A [Calditrichota bacterium]